MRCAKCGAEGISGKKFCVECGSPLSIPCSKCGADSPPDAKFCADCGASLGTAASPEKSHHSQIRVIDTPASEGKYNGLDTTVSRLIEQITKISSTHYL